MINEVRTETRRKSPRAKTASNEIVYLNFHSGNGAVVLDVSSEGLGFQAADPIEPNETLSFRLSVPAFPDIELSGRIVWLDSTRKRGGLLLNTPAEVRPVLQSWQRKYLESLPATDEQASPPAVPPRAETPTQPTQPQARPSAPHSFASRPFDPFIGSRGGPVFVSEWEMPEEPHAGRNFMVAGVIIALCLVVAGSYFLGGKRQFGNLLISLGQSISGQGAPSTAQPATAQNSNVPAQNPSAAAASDVAGPAPLSPNAAAPNPVGNAAQSPTPGIARPPQNAGAPSQQQISNSANLEASASSEPPQSAPTSNANPAASGSNAATASTPAVSASGSHDVGLPAPTGPSAQAAVPKPVPDEVEVAQAEKYLQNSNPADGAIAVNLLWSAIEAGNTQAELVLADVYLRGRRGVARNCAQAESLLNAALSSNVPGAAKEIQELQTYGCR